MKSRKAKKTAETTGNATGNITPRPHAVFWAAGVTVTWLVFCLMLFPARYETNDDFGIIRGLCSLGGFPPDASSPVLSQSLAMLLAWLYKGFPWFPWYGAALYLSLSLGLFWMVSVLIRQGSTIGMLVCAPAMLLYSYHATVFVNYTTAALFIELGVFLALFEWVIQARCPAKHPPVYAAVLIGCAFLGYMLRWELFLYFIAFGLPMALFVKKHDVKRIVPYLLLFALLIAGDRALFHLSSSPEDEAFMTYNELRRVFHDTAKGEFYPEKTPAALKAAGWTMEDYAAYKSWMLYDDQLFNAETLSAFLRENDPQKTESIPRLFVKRISESYRNSKYYSIAVVLSWLALLLTGWRWIGNGAVSRMWKRAATAGAVLLLIVFFAYYRFEPRIFVPLYSYSLVLVLLLVRDEEVPEKTGHRFALLKRWGLPVAAMFALGACYAGFSQAAVLDRVLSTSLTEKAYFVNCLNDFMKREQAKAPLIVLMNPTDSLGIQHIHPLKEFSDYAAVKIMPAGTSVNSPRYRQILGQLGLSGGRAFLQWTIGNDRAFFALVVRNEKQRKDFVTLWESYVNRRIASPEKAGLRPVYDYRGKSGSGLVLYRLDTKGT